MLCLWMLVIFCQKYTICLFPQKNKHSITFKKWVPFCKKKNFETSSGIRICSKHFRPKGMNQSDLL